MEITCERCRQTVPPEASFCPACGLPQLVYNAEEFPEPGLPQHWNGVVRDASSVAWKPALQFALMLGIPAGLLCAMLAQLGILALAVMAITAMWVVTLYMRQQQPAWITMGAGARIGLVTGLIGGWTATATIGTGLYAMRFWFHQGRIFDDFWQTLVTQQMIQQWTNMGVDAQTMALAKSWLLAPEGRAGWMAGAMVFLMTVLLLMAMAGGALGARWRSRRPKV